VTTIIKGSASNPFIPSSAMLRGTMVHSITVMMDYDRVTLDDVPEEYRGYIEAWETFKKDFAFTLEFAEVRGTGLNNRYAGCIDRLGILKGEPVVLDIKTGAKASWHDLQMAGYAGLSGEGWTGQGRNLGLVYLKSDNQYRFEPVRDVDKSAAIFRAKLIEYEKGVKHE